MSGTAVLVLAHGSDVAGSRNVAVEQAARISEKLGLPAYGATLRMQEPKVDVVLPRMCAECDPDRIVVIPLMFSEGIYTRKMIPRAVGIPEGEPVCSATVCGRERRFAMAGVFASHPEFPRILNRVLRTCGEKGRVAALVITHGTPDGSGNALAEECAKAFTDRQVPAMAAYNEFQKPDVGEALEALVDANPLTDVVVAIPLFISPSNHSRNEIPAKLGAVNGAGTCERNGRSVRIVYADEIGIQPAVADLLADRVLEAEKKLERF